MALRPGPIRHSFRALPLTPTGRVTHMERIPVSPKISRSINSQTTTTTTHTRLRCCPSLTLITHTQITGSVQYPDAVLHVTLPCVFTACLTPRLSLFVLPLSEELKLASQKSQHLEEVLTFTKSLLYKQSPSSRHRSPEVRNSDLINSLWHREDFCPALTEAQTGLASI